MTYYLESSTADFTGAYTLLDKDVEISIDYRPLSRGFEIEAIRVRPIAKGEQWQAVYRGEFLFGLIENSETILDDIEFDRTAE